MRRLAVVFGLVTLVLAAPVAPSQAAKPKIKCAYAQAGQAGLAGNRLDIRVLVPEETVALRVLPSGRIEVTDDKRMRRLRCSGRKATITNIDRVSYGAPKRAETTNLVLVEPTDFTADGDGIFFSVSGKAISFAAIGTDGTDTFAAGDTGGAVGIDFDPGAANGRIDARIKAGFTNLNMLLRDGDDSFDATGFPDFDGPLSMASTSVYGEAGNDRITGGNAQDYLDGGDGSDSLIGSGGADILSGGRGIDGFDAGAGRDEIDAIDRRAELVECGPGEDLISMDLTDDDSNCEVFRFP